uniref:Uncharacterized protein n=1 Tax=Gallus gallus TaxID=9031 RepID=A0A8V0Y015_CHICK
CDCAPQVLFRGDRIIFREKTVREEWVDKVSLSATENAVGMGLSTIQSHWRLIWREFVSLFLHCCTLTFCYGGEKERRLSVKEVTGTLSSASSCDLCVNTRRRVKCHLLGCKVVFWGKNNAIF